MELVPVMESLPVCVKQFRYIMNGMHTGDIFRHRGGRVQWHHKESGMQTPWHGEWFRTHDRSVIQAHFDFAGIEDKKKMGVAEKKIKTMLGF